ncbi:hypothetical protein B5M09_005138 [Aphanomyces astaci]|uniref:Protein kinase domain-containing protein n=1 Tax=Aphanomyces astaci TaxID=112090 RepID=A0A3R7Y657_APHAT|nr:hypothetical protein B5M09_005138 [Aphanomyces astaci]
MQVPKGTPTWATRDVYDVKDPNDGNIRNIYATHRRFHIHMSFRERRGAPPALQMDDEYTEDEDGKSGGCPYETNVLEMSCDIGDTTFRKGRLAITISFSTLSLVGFYGAYFKDQALSLILQYCDRGSLDGLVIQILSGLQHLKEARHFHRVMPTYSV